MDGVQITALSTLVGLFVWYLKTQTRQEAKREDKHDKMQTEEREFNRSIVKNELKELHRDSVKVADLHSKSIIVINEIGKNLQLHNGHTEKFSEKVLGAFDVLCDKMNGGSPESIALKKKLKEYEEKGIVINRRKKNIPVGDDRRK